MLAMRTPSGLDVIHQVRRHLLSAMAPGRAATGAASISPATDTLAPEGSGADCGCACHTIIAAKDYVFTAYGKK
jgi:hypothetical protein